MYYYVAIETVSLFRQQLRHRGRKRRRLQVFFLLIAIVSVVMFNC